MKSENKTPLHSFGIETPALTASEKAAEEQRFIDALSAVIAVQKSSPLRPRASSLGEIYQKLHPTKKPIFWNRVQTWSGWAAAAAITLFFLTRPSLFPSQATSEQASSKSSNHSSAPKTKNLKPDKAVISPPATTENEHLATATTAIRENAKFSEKQRSLIQEIEILRDKVSTLTARESERLTVSNGVSWPVIMKLTSPGQDAATIALSDPLMSAMLGETSTATRRLDASAIDTASPAQPSAIPIYDSARDVGQLVVNHLPQPAEGQSYYLWMQTDTSNQPVFVGTLPDDISQSETFDFQLGSKGMIPSRFLITQDSISSVIIPNSANIILEGPQKKSN